MKFNWKLFRSTQSVADIETLRAALVRDRDELHAKIQSLWKDKGRVLDADGPEALAQHLENMRKLETELDVLNIGLEQLDARLIEARQREDAAQLEASARQAAADMKTSIALRDKFVDLIMQAAAIRDEDAALRSRIQQVAVALGKAGRQELRPADPLLQLFQSHKIVFEHPIARQTWTLPFQQVAHFAAQLAEIKNKKAA